MYASSYLHIHCYHLLHLYVGQKFPSKTLELSLQASVHFYEHNAPDYVSTTDDDPFCSGSNSYIDVRLNFFDEHM